MEPYPIIKNHIKLWYRTKMDKVSGQPIEVGRKRLMPLLKVPSRYHLEYEDHIIDGDFVIRLFRPKTLLKSPSPYVIYIRASGYAIGGVDHHNLPCAVLADKLGCCVAAVEHRLSPEYKFPIPINDCERAVRWLDKNATKLNLDNQKQVVWGECSGGNISAALCHRFQKSNEQFFLKHIMLYPAVEHQRMTPSKIKYTQGYMTDLAMLNFTLRQYLSDDMERFDLEVSPGMNEDYSNLPPTDISIGEYDIFVDESVEYAQKLKAANVPATCQVHPGLVHGFIRYFLHLPEVEAIIDAHIDDIKYNVFSF